MLNAQDISEELKQGQEVVEDVTCIATRLLEEDTSVDFEAVLDELVTTFTAIADIVDQKTVSSKC